MIEINVTNATATLVPPRESLTPGMINAAQVHFTFSKEWDGLEKTAVFSNEIETAPAEIASDIASLPTELLDAVYRWISVGVTGENADGDVVIPTIWCRLGQVLPGTSGKYVTQDQLKAYWSKQEIVFILDGEGNKFLADDGNYYYVAQGGGDVTHEQLDAALELKADKTELDDYAKKGELDNFATEAQIEAVGLALADKADVSALDGYYAKSDVSIITSGDGKKFLADDGVYRVPESSGVTQGQLDAAIAPLATKSELDAKADKTALDSYAKQYDVNQALASKADKGATETALAGKADKSEIITVTTGSGTQFLADDGTYKTVQTTPPDLSGYLTKTEAATEYATKAEVPDVATLATKTELSDGLADKADVSAIITKTDGSGTLFLADDGTYKPAAGDPPDLSAYLTKTEAATEYATKAELPDTSDMLTKTEAGTTYATKSELEDKADSATVTALSGTVTAHTAQISALETGKASTDAVAALQTELANKADASLIPDTSDMLTKTEASTTYASKTDVADTYATKTELSDGLADKADTSAIITKTDGTGTLFLADDGTYKPAAGDPPDLSAYLTKTEASDTYMPKGDVITDIGVGGSYRADIDDSGYAKIPYTMVGVEQNGTGTTRNILGTASFRTATGTQVARMGYGWTHNTETGEQSNVRLLGLSSIADCPIVTKSELDTALAGKADTADLPDTSDLLSKTEAATTYETQTHAAETFATKTDLGDTKDEIDTALADKSDNTTVDAIDTRLTTAESKIETLEAGGITGVKVAGTDAAIDSNTALIGETTVTHIQDNESTHTHHSYRIIQNAADGSEVDSFRVDYNQYDGGRTEGDFSIGTLNMYSAADIDKKMQASEATAASTYAIKAEAVTGAGYTYDSETDTYTWTESAPNSHTLEIGLTDTGAGSDKSVSVTLKNGNAEMRSFDLMPYSTADSYFLKKSDAASTYATKTEVSETYETQAHAAETYATKTELTDVVNDCADTFVTKEDALIGAGIIHNSESDTYTWKESASNGNSLEIGLTDTGAGLDKSVSVTLKNGTSEVLSYDLMPYSTVDRDFLKKSDAASTYATKSEVPDTSDMLTKTEAADTYVTISSPPIAVPGGNVTGDFPFIVSGKNAIGGTDDIQLGITIKDAPVYSNGPAPTYVSVAGTTRPSDTTATRTALLPTIETVNSLLADKADKTELSPVKSITAGNIDVEVDSEGNAQVGRTEVTRFIQGTGGASTDILTIREIAPLGTKTSVVPGTSGSSLTFTFATSGSKVTTARVTLGDSNSGYELATRDWVVDYIASLDANNTGY